MRKTLAEWLRSLGIGQRGLREATGDPLLVRAGRGLVPTPRALELRERVGQRRCGKHDQQRSGRDGKTHGRNLCGDEPVLPVPSPTPTAVDSHL